MLNSMSIAFRDSSEASRILAFNQAIAPVVVFDSGVGGLSLLKELVALRPDCRYLYLADTAWMPYGTKAPEVIGRRVEQLYRQVKQELSPTLWVLACNTASAALPFNPPGLQPLIVDAEQSLRYGQNFIDIIRPTLEMVTAAYPANAPTQPQNQPPEKPKVALLATASTVQSGRYQALLDRFEHGLELRCFACPGLAEAVEGKESALNHPLPILLDKLLAPVAAWQPEAVILACTHYLHIEAPIAAYFKAHLTGPKPARLINPATAAAKAALSYLPSQAFARPKAPNITYYVTQNPEGFYATMQGLPLGNLPIAMPRLLLSDG